MFEVIRFWSDEGKARRLARGLHKSAKAWAGMFALLSSKENPALEEALLRETLAFALTLLKARLKTDAKTAEWLVVAVRKECAALHASDKHAAPGRDDEDSEFARQFAVLAGNRSETSFKFTPEMFQEFCEFTGLGSNTLVGDGPNLASLVFYLVVHGHLFSCKTVPIEQRLQLMKGVRECRLSLEESMQGALENGPVREKDPDAEKRLPVSLPKVRERKHLGS